MTNASLGLRLTQVYHNCFYTTFTATIPLAVRSVLTATGGKAGTFHGESAKQIRPQPLRSRQE
jgi:hypothetical protein